MRARAANDFIDGFVIGLRETPRGFFAPLLALWRLLIAAAEDVPGHRRGPRHPS